MIRFGKKYRIGSFFLFKYTKTLDKKSLGVLREAYKMSDKEKRGLDRMKMPFVKVESLTGGWGIEWIAGSSPYAFLESAFDESGELIEERKKSVENYIYLLFTDTNVLGDGEYYADKGNALRAFVDRQKSESENDEEDLKAVEDMEKAISDIGEIAEKVEKEDGGNQ